MELIKKEEIKNEVSAFTKRCDPLNETLEKQADLRMGFIEGVAFAESKLKDLMAGFAEWLAENCYDNLHDASIDFGVKRGEWLYLNEKGSQLMTTHECLTKFLEERK